MKNVNVIEKVAWYRKKKLWLAILVALLSIASEFTDYPVHKLGPLAMDVIEAALEDEPVASDQSPVTSDGTPAEVDTFFVTPLPDDESGIRGHNPYSDGDKAGTPADAGNRVMSPDSAPGAGQ